MTTATPEQFTFEAEISQLLKLLSHSLYQNKEIALRELISNASDALDKQRHAALLDPSKGDDAELAITLTPQPAREAQDADGDEPAVEGREAVLTIADNGIGMSRDELIANLGTIARSGSLEYLKTLADAGGDQPSPELIGQFGVGFYSSFMLADEVEVISKSHEGPAHRWTSDGSGSYAIEEAERDSRGTTIILRLKDDVTQFANPYQLRTIVQKYSTFIAHPIFMVTESVPELDGDDNPIPPDEPTETERLNEQRPIWVEPKSQVTDEQYEGFFKHLSPMPGEPLWRLHLSFDSPLQVNSILYGPAVNMEAAGFGKYEHGLSLCAKRVLVQDDCDKLLPEYLRFVIGLVDSDDLPLNVSREALQDSSVFAKISMVLTKKVLDHLASLADDEPDTFAKLSEQFGPILREGINDFANRERVAALLRFASTRGTEKDDEKTGLEGYAERMAEGQEQIYFLVGTDAKALAENPQVKALSDHGLEVLLLDDPVDGFVLEMLAQWDGHRFVSVDSADLKLPESVQTQLDADLGEQPDGFAQVVAFVKNSLGETVKDVRAATRPTTAAATLITPEDAPSSQMQRLMAAQDGTAETPRILELNPKHELVQRLATLARNDANRETIEQIGHRLLSDAQIAAGLMPDVSKMLENSNRLMLDLAGSKSGIVT